MCAVSVGLVCAVSVACVPVYCPHAYGSIVCQHPLTVVTHAGYMHCQPQCRMGMLPRVTVGPCHRTCHVSENIQVEEHLPVPCRERPCHQPASPAMYIRGIVRVGQSRRRRHLVTGVGVRTYTVHAHTVLPLPLDAPPRAVPDDISRHMFAV